MVSTTTDTPATTKNKGITIFYPRGSGIIIIIFLIRNCSIRFVVCLLSLMGFFLDQPEIWR